MSCIPAVCEGVSGKFTFIGQNRVTTATNEQIRIKMFEVLLRCFILVTTKCYLGSRYDFSALSYVDNVSCFLILQNPQKNLQTNNISHSCVPIYDHIISFQF
jgi:hypothetical protein